MPARSTSCWRAFGREPLDSRNHFTGHLEAWFGQENNLPIGVLNDVANVMGTNLDTGHSIRVHFEQHALYVPDTDPPHPDGRPRQHDVRLE